MVFLLLLALLCVPAQAMQMPRAAFSDVCSASNTRIIETLRASVPHYANIDRDILRLFNQYRSDDHLIAALLPIAQHPLIDGRIDIRKLDDKRSLGDMALAREIDLMLQVLNRLLGGFLTKYVAKSVIVRYLQEGLFYSAE
jgi:hypothetical protein